MGMDILKTSFTGLLRIALLWIKGKPTFIFHPISKPLNKIFVGQFEKTFCEAAASWFTLNSLPEGKRPAMHTSCFTFCFTNFVPSRDEYLSAFDKSKFERLVRK